MLSGVRRTRVPITLVVELLLFRGFSIFGAILSVFLPFWVLDAASDESPRSGLDDITRRRLGPYLIYLERAPFRLSVLASGRPILAMRAVRDRSALELREDGPWVDLSTLVVAAEASGRTAASRHDFTVSGGGSHRVSVETVWSEADKTLSVRFAAAAVTRGLRCDWVPQRDEILYGVDAALFSGDERPDAARFRDVSLVFSSAGYAFSAQGESGVAVFAPDSGAFRVESRGAVMEIRLCQGPPRRTWRRLSGRRFSAQPRDDDGEALSDGVDAGRLLVRGDDERRASSVARRISAQLRGFGAEPKILLEIRDRGVRELAPQNVRGGGDWSLPTPEVDEVVLRKTAHLDRARVRTFRGALAGRRVCVVLPLTALPGVVGAESFRSLALARPTLCFEVDADGERDLHSLTPHEFQALAGWFCFVKAAAQFERQPDRAAAASRLRPQLRPVFFDAPTDRRAWQAADAWVFGPLLFPTANGIAREPLLFFPSGEWTGVGDDGGGAGRVVGPELRAVSEPFVLYERVGAAPSLIDAWLSTRCH